jgi:hypothetical protein
MAEFLELMLVAAIACNSDMLWDPPVPDSQAFTVLLHQIKYLIQQPLSNMSMKVPLSSYSDAVLCHH